ncbi:MAG: hypothetical protein Ct9H90mP5_10690 [Acidimicrobiaceae bacterium]|nr:MAG: hypothetical protein Ct9H90mP5_10690 [Acidimicrobiaceae bacterium]
MALMEEMVHGLRSLGTLGKIFGFFPLSNLGFRWGSVRKGDG